MEDSAQDGGSSGSSSLPETLVVGHAGGRAASWPAACSTCLTNSGAYGIPNTLHFIRADRVGLCCYRLHRHESPSPIGGTPAGCFKTFGVFHMDTLHTYRA